MSTVSTDLQLGNAARLVALGCALFPLDHPSLPRCIGRHRPAEPCDGKRGKHPVPRSWPAAATDDLDVLERDFGRGPRNIGVSCGRSGLVVLDEDEPGAWDRAVAGFGEPVDTFTVATGRGRHLWFRQPEDLPFGNAVGRFRGLPIDVRGRGGYVIGPGSLHQSGREYETADWAAPIQPVPAWLHEALTWAPLPARSSGSPAPTGRGNERKALVGIIRVILDAPQGTQNNCLYWGARRLFERVADGRLSEQEAHRMLTEAAAQLGHPISRTESTIRSARKAVLGG